MSLLFVPIVAAFASMLSMTIRADSEPSLVTNEDIPLWPWKRSEYVTLLASHDRCAPNVSIANDSSLHVCDPDSLLSPTQLMHLQHLLMDVENTTRCSLCPPDWPCTASDNGLTVGVAMARQSFYKPGSQEDEFADAIRDKWRLSACDNDLIMFISIKEKQLISLSLGNTSKSVLDQTFASMYTTIKHNFTASSDTTLIYPTLIVALHQLAQTYRNQLAAKIAPLETATAATTSDRAFVLSWNVLLISGYCSVVFLLVLAVGYYCLINRTSRSTGGEKRATESTLSTELMPTRDSIDKLVANQRRDGNLGMEMGSAVT